MKTPFLRVPRTLVQLAAAALLAVTVPAEALKVDMYAVGNWSGGNCTPGNTDNDRGAWPGMARAWYDAMGFMGNQRTGAWVDGNITTKLFCDPSWDASCRDFSYVDWPDAAIVAAHGYDAGNRWGALMRNSWNGYCHTKMGGECAPGTDSRLCMGDNNLKFLHASSCLSLNDNYFGNMRYAFKKNGSSKGLHMMLGFHGVMFISSSFNGNYSSTAIDGHFMPVANAWTNNHYKSNKFECAAWDPFNWFGTCQDQCPTAMTIGATPGNALNRLLNERYNNSAVFGSPTGRSYYAWMGYVGCDPVAEDAFKP
jgi:hypothetical protein